MEVWRDILHFSRNSLPFCSILLAWSSILFNFSPFCLSYVSFSTNIHRSMFKYVQGYRWFKYRKWNKGIPDSSFLQMAVSRHTNVLTYRYRSRITSAFVCVCSDRFLLPGLISRRSVFLALVLSITKANYFLRFTLFSTHFRLFSVTRCTLPLSPSP